MANTIEIIINAKDKASGVIGGVGNALAGLGKVAIGGALVGITALAGGLALSVKEALEAEEVDARLTAVLKATGGAAGITADMANDLADALSKETRFSDEAVKSAETVLLTFKNINKDAFPQATELSLDLATALGVDASSAARMLGKALETPGEGLMRLKAAGVAFTDADDQMIASMIEAGDTAGAQKYIMDALATSIGGMAEAAGDTTAGKFEIFKNALLNVAEGIGTSLLPIGQMLIDNFLTPALPVIQALATQFTAWLLPAIQAVGGWISTNLMPVLAAIWGWLATNIPLAIATLSAFWTTVLLPAITAVWTWISTNLIPLFMEIGGILTNTVGASVTSLSGAWTNTLQPALQGAWNTIQTQVLPALQGLFDWIATVLPPVIKALGDFFTGVLLPAITTVVGWIIDNLVPILAAIVTWLATNIPVAINAVVGFWNDVLWPALQTVGQWISDNLMPVLEKVASFWSTIITGAINVFVPLWNDTLWPALQTVGAWISDTLVPILGDIASWIGDVIVGAIEGYLATWNDVFLPALQDVAAWITDTLLPTLAGIVTWFVDAAVSIASWITDTWDKLKGAFEDVGNYVTDTLIPQFTEIITWFSDNAQAIKDFIANSIEKLEQAWGNVTGAVDAVIAKFQALLDWIKENWQKIKDALADIWPGSPSKLQIALEGIGEALGWTTEQFDRMLKTIESASWGQFVKIMGELDTALLMNIGQGLSSFGNAIGGRYQDKVLNPLASQIQGYDTRLAEISKMLSSGTNALGGQLGFGEAQRLMDEMADLEWAKTQAIKEYEEAQAHILEMQQKQADLQFLQQQLEFLQFLKDYGLNPEDILGGMEMGLGASLPDLLDAMTRAMEQVIEAAQNQLGIHSPSKVFGGMGLNAVKSLAAGFSSGVNQASSAIGGAARSLSASVQNNWNLTIHEAGRVVDPARSFQLMKVLAGT